MSDVSESVLRLGAGTEEFGAAPMGKTGPELTADLRELARGRNLLDLKFSQMAAAFAATDEFDREGSYSPIHWIRMNCHMTGGAAADRVAVGEQVAHVSETVAAMAGGQIGFPHLALIAREAKALVESGGNKQVEETKRLAQAGQVRLGRFRNFCHHYRDAGAPKGYATS